MRIKLLLGISVAIVALAALSVIAVGSSKQAPASGTLEKENCSSGCTHGEAKVLESGGKVCPITGARAGSTQGKDPATCGKTCPLDETKACCASEKGTCPSGSHAGEKGTCPLGETKACCASEKGACPSGGHAGEKATCPSGGHAGHEHATHATTGGACPFHAAQTGEGQETAQAKGNPAASEALTPEEEVRKFKWQTNYEKAVKLAQATQRPILVDFSGSDWCGWCIRLDQEVLTQKAFQEYAKENLVLFLADFPRKTKLPAEIQQQNEELARKHKVQGFPTVLLLNQKGEVLARTGYQAGGPEAYVRHIKDLLEKAKTREKPSA